MSKHIINAPKLANQLRRSLLANPRTTRKVVCCIAHQRQNVYDLGWGRDAILTFHLLFTKCLVTSAMLWTIHVNVWSNQLTIVLVRRKHKSFDSIGTESGCNSTYDVICLEAIYLQDGDVQRL